MDLIRHDFIKGLRLKSVFIFTKLSMIEFNPAVAGFMVDGMSSACMGHHGIAWAEMGWYGIVWAGLGMD
ncbi:hypothetical protein J7K93_01125 [bacterium]|nr:hypothetical protein [bacterium]